jgi:prophage tail gpP-like protein
MSIEVRINGIVFTLWETALVQRSIDSNAGVFRFTNSSSTPIRDYPLKAGDFIEILIDCYKKISGFIDDFIDGGDAGSHTISISGRDNIQDLIDSSVPDSAKVTDGQISLKALIERVIASLPEPPKIKVIEQITGLADFTEEEIEAAGSGETCMAYLVNFARKRQVYLVPDGAGNMLIYRPDRSNKAKGALIHKPDNPTNNVLNYSTKRSQQGRFRKILCRSQDNFGFDPLADYSGDGTDRKSEAIDDQMRATRYLEIQAEESMSDAECLERASEEVNIRRASGEGYTATLQGHAQTDGTVWDFGQFVQVDDEFADIQGEFLIKAVEWSENLRQGITTRLVCVPPDAYQVIAEPTPETKRTAKTGTAFQNETPVAQPETTR